MTAIARAAAAAAAVLVREGVDYAQSKAVFKATRARAGLSAAPERRGGVDRLTVEEELRFLDRAYVQDGRTGLMLQTLLETGARASELVQLRVEDVSLSERVVTIQHGKGGKRREVPIRRDLAQFLRLHVGTRRAGPLFASRQQGSGAVPHTLTRQRVGQIVREVGPCVWFVRCTVISDRAELDTFACPFSANSDYVFSMRYGRHKSCAEVSGFCNMFRILFRCQYASATECEQESDFTMENLL